MKVVKHLRN